MPGLIHSLSSHSSDNYDLKSKSTRSGGSGGGGRSRDNNLFPDEGDIKVSVVLEGVPDHHFVRGITQIVPEYAPIITIAPSSHVSC